MPGRAYRSDPAELLEEARGILSSSSEAKYQHRVEMVSLVLAGLTPQFLSEHVKESKNAITGWVKVADEQGFEALRAKRQPGRPRKLTGEQLEEVRGVVADGSWDGPSLSEHVLTAYGVELSARQCQRIIQGLGA
jgi:transposase